MVNIADIQQVKREREKDDISLQGKGLKALLQSSRCAQEWQETWRGGCITSTALWEPLLQCRAWLQTSPGKNCTLI